MSRYVDELYRNPGQPGLRALLRGMLKLLFRGLIRPPVPFAVQALVLRLLTLGMPLARGVTRSTEQIAGRPCMWHRPAAGGNGRVLLLPGLGHVPHLEAPDIVVPPLVAFLEEGVGGSQ